MKKLTARQVAALSPEVRERYEKKLKKVTRNRRILTGIIAVVAVAAVFAVLSVTVLFNVSEIKVAKAGTHYKAEEIILAFEVVLDGELPFAGTHTFHAFNELCLVVVGIANQYVDLLYLW